ncbi:acyltransferase, WS/DGAT/MGAT [Marinobacter sp. LV10R510-11A]|uniref:WS/DGAT domain-containing protein n=1 Tax=Marinobacter sp. LV10R510-11A TaxID=1415568 RepID=UPI000BB9BC78|nr:WS/DGAT domain-containing protein [Marinobacter sp. LV10R510-11A]SOB77835.1 acyltransferase, WS/DGAT/MGAT [Marinobacter sp. LV10R510-11A]
MSHEQTHLMLPADSAWLALESPRNPMTITVMMRVDGLTAPRLREFLRVYWMAWERFRYMPVKRAPGWQWEPDPVFDLRHHLDVVLDRFTDSALQEWVSERLNQPLPLYRPLWKFWLAPNAEGGSVLLLRLHHCYADGVSLTGIFDRLCSTSPQQHPAVYGARQTGNLAPWMSAAKNRVEQLLGGDAAAEAGTNKQSAEPGSQFDQARTLLDQAARNGVKLVNEFSDFLAEPEDTPSDLKRALLGQRHCRWSAPVALGRFRSIAKATNVTINDVLLSCVAAAVRPRLGISGADLEDAVMHAAVPVDIRDRLPDDLKPEPDSLGNYFGTVFVPLPVDGESALERLYRIKQETRRLKKSWQPGIAWGLSACASLIPDALRQPLLDVFYRKASAVVSNVIGTPEARYIAGCRITEQMFWVPQAGDIGLGVSIVSYAGQVQFGVVADEAVLADPAEFLQDCLQELSEFPGGSPIVV